MANSVTLADVAKLAGVSVGTASQSLNNRPNVASKTRARVMDAARTLGYPTKQERYPELRIPVRSIGLLVKRDLGAAMHLNPFYSLVQMGVESECRRREIGLMYANIEVDESNHPVSWPPMIEEHQNDGLILAGTFIEETVDLFRRRTEVPIILVDSYAPNLAFDSVVIDNVPGAMKAVDHLIECGHTKIGLLGWNESSPPSVQDRKLGYCQALKKHGIEETWILPSDLMRENGPRFLGEILDRFSDITAVFACNDMCAAGVLAGAREMGINCPQDLSVIGFDNIGLARELMPALTTIHVNKTWLGALGVRQLVERIQTPDQPKLTILISTDLIVRDSVCSLYDVRR